MQTNNLNLNQKLSPAEIEVLKGQVAAQLNYTKGTTNVGKFHDVLEKLSPDTIEKLKNRLTTIFPDNPKPNVGSPLTEDERNFIKSFIKKQFEYNFSSDDPDYIKYKSLIPRLDPKVITSFNENIDNLFKD